MANILHLETATKVCSVALSSNGKLIALKETQEDGYSHGENLTLFIEDLLKSANLSMKDLNAVSIASGPGSYTGLRIGVSTAKGLCYALGIPMIAIDALTSLCEIAREKHSDQNLCAMIDARRMEVYSIIQDKDGNVLKEISADILDETSYAEFQPFIFFGDGAAKMDSVWSGESKIIDASISSSATGQIRLAYEAFQKEKFEDIAYFEPFYLKDFVVGKKTK